MLEDGLDSRAPNLLRASTRVAAFLDWWTLDSANLCTAGCRTMTELGTTLGIYAGSRQIWPVIFEDTVRAASDADNPTEAEIGSLGASITGSMCSSKATRASSLVLAAEPYILNGVPDLEEDTVGFVRMAERMLKVMLAPTEYGEGICSENEYPNMLAKMVQLGTRHGVKLLENLWEGEEKWEGNDVWEEEYEQVYNSTCKPICEYSYVNPTYDWQACNAAGCESQNPGYNSTCKPICDYSSDNPTYDWSACNAADCKTQDGGYNSTCKPICDSSSSTYDWSACDAAGCEYQDRGYNSACKPFCESWSDNPTYDSSACDAAGCEYQSGGYNSACKPICDYSYVNPTYDWSACDAADCEKNEWSGGYRWVPYQTKEEDWRIVTPGGMTTPELDSMVYDAMHCFCDYWTGPGDVFPLVESKVAQYKANEPDDWGEEFAEAGQLAMRSAKTCSSMQCRGLFDSLFALVEKLSGVSLTQGGITYNNEPACNAVHADKCWRGECWPVNQESNYPGQCAMCYAPTESSSQLYPMAWVDDFADRIMFWSTCSMSTDCPPANVESYQVTATFTVAIAAADFGEDKQEAFKQKFVEMLAPPGSDLEGSIAASDVTLTITEQRRRRASEGNSINVQATVSVYSESVKTAVTGKLDEIASDPSSAARMLGVPVTEVGEVDVTSVAFSPPSPPTPPPGGGKDDSEDDGLSAGALAGIVVGVVGGLCCCGLVCFLAVFLYKKQEAGKTASMMKQSSTTTAPAASELAVVASAADGTKTAGVKLDMNQHTLATWLTEKCEINAGDAKLYADAVAQLGIDKPEDLKMIGGDEVPWPSVIKPVHRMKIQSASP